jgi:hypothetical protein
VTFGAGVSLRWRPASRRSFPPLNCNDHQSTCKRRAGPRLQLVGHSHEHPRPPSDHSSVCYIYGAVTPHRPKPLHHHPQTPSHAVCHPPKVGPPLRSPPSSSTPALRSAHQARFAVQQFAASIRIVGTSGERAHPQSCLSTDIPARQRRSWGLYQRLSAILTKHPGDHERRCYPAPDPRPSDSAAGATTQRLFPLDLVRGQHSAWKYKPELLGDSKE